MSRSPKHKKASEQGILEGFIASTEIDCQLLMTEDESNKQFDATLLLADGRKIAVEVTTYISQVDKTIEKKKVEAEGNNLKGKIWEKASRDKEFQALPEMIISVRMINNTPLLPKKADYDKFAAAIVEIAKLWQQGKFLSDLSLIQFPNEFSMERIEGLITPDAAKIVRAYIDFVQMTINPRKQGRQMIGVEKQDFIDSHISLGTDDDVFWGGEPVENLQEIVDDNQNKLSVEHDECWLLIHAPKNASIKQEFPLNKGIYQKIFVGSYPFTYVEF